MQTRQIIHQDHLLQQLKFIFPNDKPLVNSRKQSQLKHPSNAVYFLELDVWFPAKNICFEFQDNYHYETHWYTQIPLSQVQSNDEIKKEVAEQQGLRLIVVPSWWDGSTDSLSSTISFFCPDLIVSTDHAPISLNIPANFLLNTGVPGVGELMYASFPGSIHNISQGSWWLGEKYDGVRVCYNPIHKNIYSRRGHKYFVPAPFIKLMAPIFMDGEFWFGRQEFSQVYTLFKNNHEFVLWHALRLISFDSPAQKLPFEFRYAQLVARIDPHNPIIINAPRLFLEDQSKLGLLIQIIINDGGEGIIMRKVKSLYEHGRSLFSLLKIKGLVGENQVFREDKEGIIIGFQNKLVQVQLANGIIFKVPPENVYVSGLRVEDIVTFSYENHVLRGISVNPIIHRVRPDILWKDISQIQYGQPTNAHRSHSQKFTPHAHRRRLFENYAKERGFDALIPQQWYRQPVNKMSLNKDIARVVKSHYNKNMSAALQNIFPEIKFDRKLFGKSQWSEPAQQRKLLEQYARDNAFDPLNPENWYTQSRKKLLKYQGAQAILYKYGNMSSALISLFPDIRLQKQKLWKAPFSERTQRRRMFEDYAHRNSFDPLNPRHWYKQSRKKIMDEMPGAKSVILHYYKHSLSMALLDLFPEIGLDKKKLGKGHHY